MADEREKDGGEGLFRPGRHYPEVDPCLGRLHESWHVSTGRPALTLLPGDQVDWAPSEACAVLIVFDPKQHSVSIVSEKFPASVQTEEVSNLLTLAKAGLVRVEEDPLVRAHLASALLRREARPWRMVMGVGFAVLGLGLGVWLYASKAPYPSAPASAVVAAECPADGTAPLLTDSNPPVPQSLAYPLPAKPFKDQAAAPCQPDVGEEEINGGCWLALKQQPPCLKVQAEYQGTCYLPVTKHRSRPPQSARP